MGRIDGYRAVMVEIPEDFARGIVDREGEDGRAWVAGLPGLADELLRRWGCTPAAAIRFGQVGVILPVQRRDGLPAVLKISFTHPGNRYEAQAFAVWGGRGAVRLYERDDAKFAMLLEQAEWQTLDDLGDIDQATAVLGRLARRLAVPAPPELPRLSDRAGSWEQELLDGAARPGSRLTRKALEAALATVEDLARKQPETMVHGDLHFGNVVRSHREPWLVVDPKGLAGDLASDAFRVLVRGADSLFQAADLGAELRRRLAIFADAAQTDRDRAYRWLQLDAAIAATHDEEPAWVSTFLARVADLMA
ncbi:aminoglycoside phosphotransferase family protein [Flindersiella endophytica]